MTLPVTPPEGMAFSHFAKVLRLRDEARCRVLERAAIIHEACGVPWAEADARAWELEAIAQRGLFGGAR